MNAKPLAGRRVVITREEERAREAKALLESLGAEPIVFPTVAFAAIESPELEQAAARLDHYDWIIFSSANAVRFFLSRFKETKIGPNGPRVAAVGAVTARLLMEKGLRVDFVPQEFTGEALAAGIGARGRRFLLPRSRIGRVELVDALRKQGALVDDIPIYDTVPAQPTLMQMAQLALGFDAILFASPSAVHYYLELTESEPIIQEHTRAAIIACIGPTTAAACEARGLPVHVVPAQHTMADMIRALADEIGGPKSEV